MRSRMNIMLAAILIMLGALIWIVVRGKTTVVTVMAPVTPSSTPALRPQERPQPAVLAATVESVPALVPTLPQRPADASDAVKANGGEKAAYTAVAGDTLSNVAAGLLGSDSKKNRNAVIAANPSLQANPDRVLDGKTYVLAAPSADPVATVTPEVQPVASAPATATIVPDATHSSSDRVLKYTAQAGDSVSALAAGLLGSDSKSNRDAIISQNQSLQNDPDHVVAGKTYKIPTSTGLSAAPAQESRPTTPATQPDADGVVKTGAARELRYTARAGDSVSKLAEVLLGSDTQANRDAIINNNAALKSDPDRVVAGQSYWIPAPAAQVQQP